MYRRALDIDEASYGTNHSSVAIRLHNLADTLLNANRLDEAEPMMRRALTIFLAFQYDTGHAHPNRDAAIGNYFRLLTTMGKSKAEIAASLTALGREAGLTPILTPKP